MATISEVGGVAGLIALAWQAGAGAKEWWHRPQLAIRPFNRERDLRTWTMVKGDRAQRAFTLEVCNLGRRRAERCVATLEITRCPDTVRLQETRFALHWAGVDYAFITTGAQPVDIGSEDRRLDVLFTIVGGIPGCWIATGMALSLPDFHQAYLPPGHYEATLSLACEGGRPVTIRLAFTSPPTWDTLEVALNPTSRGAIVSS